MAVWGAPQRQGRDAQRPCSHLFPTGKVPRHRKCASVMSARGSVLLAVRSSVLAAGPCSVGIHRGCIPRAAQGARSARHALSTLAARLRAQDLHRLQQQLPPPCRSSERGWWDWRPVSPYGIPGRAAVLRGVGCRSACSRLLGGALAIAQWAVWGEDTLNLSCRSCSTSHKRIGDSLGQRDGA